MKKMFKKFKSFLMDEEGATAVEYAIMVALIAIVVIATVTLVGKRANSTFNKVQSALQST
jgi:pilus assembly protein Flp/PilA